MWPFKKEARVTQADVRVAEDRTVVLERSAKASELRLARKVNQMLQKLQDAPIDVGLEHVARDIRGE